MTSEAEELLLEGRALRRHGRLDEAAARYGRAIGLTPDDPRLWTDLGQTLREAGKGSAAVACLRRALGLAPGQPGARAGLASLLREQGRPREAVDLLAVPDPDRIASDLVLGLALTDLGRLEEAFQVLDRAGAAAPGRQDIAQARAEALLLAGRLSDGFALRGDCPAPDATRNRIARLEAWTGTQPSGRTILLHAGDDCAEALQFARYIPLVASLGARVVVECRQSLRALLSRVEGVERVVVRGGGAVEADLHAPMAALPRLFGTDLDTVPAHVPYFRPASETSLALRTPVSTRLRVGICWAHNPAHGPAPTADTDAPLELFLELAGIPGVALYNLQTGEAASARQRLGHPVLLHDSGEAHDFADAASLASQLDLVITVDTALAHLAGGLGVPTWLLLPARPNWRWMLDREDSPWYPTMRLFRQDSHGWGPVFARVATALAELAAKA